MERKKVEQRRHVEMKEADAKAVEFMKEYARMVKFVEDSDLPNDNVDEFNERLVKILGAFHNSDDANMKISSAEVASASLKSLETDMNELTGSPERESNKREESATEKLKDQFRDYEKGVNKRFDKMNANIEKLTTLVKSLQEGQVGKDAEEKKETKVEKKVEEEDPSDNKAESGENLSEVQKKQQELRNLLGEEEDFTDEFKESARVLSDRIDSLSDEEDVKDVMDRAREIEKGIKAFKEDVEESEAEKEGNIPEQEPEQEEIKQKIEARIQETKDFIQGLENLPDDEKEEFLENINKAIKKRDEEGRITEKDLEKLEELLAIIEASAERKNEMVGGGTEDTEQNEQLGDLEIRIREAGKIYVEQGIRADNDINTQKAKVEYYTLLDEYRGAKIKEKIENPDRADEISREQLKFLKLQDRELYEARLKAKSQNLGMFEKFGKGLHKVFDWYKNSSREFKLASSALLAVGGTGVALMGGGVVAGGAVGLGVWTKKILGSGAAGTGMFNLTEERAKAAHERSVEKELKEADTKEKLEVAIAKYDNDTIEKGKKSQIAGRTRRWAYGIGTAATVMFGGKLFGSFLNNYGDGVSEMVGKAGSYAEAGLDKFKEVAGAGVDKFNDIFESGDGLPSGEGIFEEDIFKQDIVNEQTFDYDLSGEEDFSDKVKNFDFDQETEKEVPNFDQKSGNQSFIPTQEKSYQFPQNELSVDQPVAEVNPTEVQESLPGFDTESIEVNNQGNIEYVNPDGTAMSTSLIEGESIEGRVTNMLAQDPVLQEVTENNPKFSGILGSSHEEARGHVIAEEILKKYPDFDPHTVPTGSTIEFDMKGYPNDIKIKDILSPSGNSLLQVDNIEIPDASSAVESDLQVPGVQENVQEIVSESDPGTIVIDNGPYEGLTNYEANCSKGIWGGDHPAYYRAIRNVNVEEYLKLTEDPRVLNIKAPFVGDGQLERGGRLQLADEIKKVYDKMVSNPFENVPKTLKVGDFVAIYMKDKFKI